MPDEEKDEYDDGLWTFGALAWRIIRRIAASRTGQFLFVVHLCFCLFDYASKPIVGSADGGCTPQVSLGLDYMLIAGRPFQWSYESALMKIVTVLDFPAIFVGFWLSGPLNWFYPNLCLETESWIEAGLFLVCTSIQWWIVGWALGWAFGRSRKAC